MPLREFKCSSGHVQERLLFGNNDAKTMSVRCSECGLAARRIEISLPYVFSPDFLVARSYERRKNSEPPIHGSSSHPDTEAPSTRPLSFSSRTKTARGKRGGRRDALQRS